MSNTNNDYPTFTTCQALKAAGWDQTITTKYYNGLGELYDPPAVSIGRIAAPSLAQLLDRLDEHETSPEIIKQVGGGWECQAAGYQFVGATHAEAAAAAVLHVLRSKQPGECDCCGGDALERVTGLCDTLVCRKCEAALRNQPAPVASHEPAPGESQAPLPRADDPQPYLWAKGVDLKGGEVLWDGGLRIVKECDGDWAKLHLGSGNYVWTSRVNVRPAPHDWQVGDTARVVSTAHRSPSYDSSPVGTEFTVAQIAGKGVFQDDDRGWVSRPGFGCFDSRDLLYIPPAEPARPEPLYRIGQRVVNGEHAGRATGAEWVDGEWRYLVALATGRYICWRESKLRTLKEALPKGGK